MYFWFKDQDWWCFINTLLMNKLLQTTCRSRLASAILLLGPPFIINLALNVATESVVSHTCPYGDVLIKHQVENSRWQLKLRSRVTVVYSLHASVMWWWHLSALLYLVSLMTSHGTPAVWYMSLSWAIIQQIERLGWVNTWPSDSDLSSSLPVTGVNKDNTLQPIYMYVWNLR